MNWVNWATFVSIFKANRPQKKPQPLRFFLFRERRCNFHSPSFFSARLSLSESLWWRDSSAAKLSFLCWFVYKGEERGSRIYWTFFLRSIFLSIFFYFTSGDRSSTFRWLLFFFQLEISELSLKWLFPETLSFLALVDCFINFFRITLPRLEFQINLSIVGPPSKNRT